MSQVLVLFTLEYPDPLLEKELDSLSREFDTVYLLPAKVNGSPELPANVQVVSIFDAVDLNRPWFLLIKHLPAILRIYGWTLFKSGYRKNYIKYFKSFLGHLIIEAEKIKPLARFIKEKGLQHALFYDYWFVDATLALAELKRKGIVRFCVSRAHRFDLYHECQFEKRVSFQRYRLKYLDSVFTVSQHGHNYLINDLPVDLKKKIKLSYLGVDNLFRAQLPAKDSSKGFTIVSCANLIPVKRMDLLIDTLKLSRLDCHWIHFGSGPLYNSLKKRAESLPQNIRAEFKGEVDNKKVLEFYQHNFVDLFVSVSESEGLPVSMMEAASVGIPVLACSVNGIPEIVSEQTGVLLAKDASPQLICDTLEDTLLHKRFDREYIRRQCWEKFDAAENFTFFIREIKKIANMEMKERSSHSYQQCVRCVLDTNDAPLIEFDSKGICSYCRQYEIEASKLPATEAEAEKAVHTMVENIKSSGKGKQYDCIMGLSGGVDSTYLAYKAKQLGLRPLAVHFDNGWNSELAVENIERIVTRLGIDLHTLVVDWNEFRDLQMSFFKASVIDIELATDHAILATMYKLAMKHGIKYVLSGHNIATELILPVNWYHDKRDHIHIQAIHKKFGTVPLRTYPLMTSFMKFMIEWHQIKSARLLDYMRYNKKEVKEKIAKELGWRDYGGKHYESIFTRFYQGYVLVEKFKVDKRRAHLSNLICSGQMTRDEVIRELQIPPYSQRQFEEDFTFVLKKLNLSRAEFQDIMNLEIKKHTDYEVDRSIYDRYVILRMLLPFWKIFKKMRSRLNPSA